MGPTHPLMASRPSFEFSVPSVCGVYVCVWPRACVVFWGVHEWWMGRTHPSTASRPSFEFSIPSVCGVCVCVWPELGERSRCSKLYFLFLFRFVCRSLSRRASGEWDSASRPSFEFNFPSAASACRASTSASARGRNSGRACVVPSCIFFFFSSWSDLLRGGSMAMATDHIHITIMYLMRHAPDSSACTRFFQTSRFWFLCCARGLDL
jgi:hypothetical protein